ncbi:hypothetical protein [Roseibium sp.]|uniref:hypothetical protein n=1 Tax=Roseibium sp. TaxID=1936156 RepID=UPI003D135C4E
MSGQTLNNDRGAKRAEDLRKRFNKVSTASLGRNGPRNPFRMDPGRQSEASRYNPPNKALGFWLVVALLVMGAALFL